MRISQAAFDLIVGEEVTSQSVYERCYRRPTWPGESSGPTVGVGYDLGQTPQATIVADWRGRVSSAMLDVMASASGKKGSAGKRFTEQIKQRVDIPWDTALAVHRDCVIPRWEAVTAKALPNTGQLSLDCFGALVSLTFNRGAALYTKPGDRYREMRAIKQAMAAGHFAEIPDLIRAMKRIWSGRGVDGLLRRRDREAALFERGLKAMSADDSAGLQPKDSTMTTVHDTEQPPWLATMRAITGTRETPGSADNPTIMAWRDEIGNRFPPLKSYSRTYTHDSIAWCGLTVAYVMAVNGIEPPKTFLWARDWARWGVSTKPRLGCVMVFTRGDGGHVALYEGETATQYIVRGGNQSDEVNTTKIAKSRLLAARWPAEQPSAAAPVSSLPSVTTVPVPIAGPARPGFWGTVMAAVRGDTTHVATDHAPVARPGLSVDGDPQLYDIQAQLAAKGYSMVGVADGEMGPNTQSAVLTFRSENGLPVNNEIDDQFRAALAGAPYRRVAAQRASATVGDLRRGGSGPIATLDGFKWLGGLVTGAGALGGIANSGALEQMQATVGTINDTAATVGSLVSTVIGAMQWMANHWWLLALFLGLYIFYRVGKGFLEIVALFRQGILAR